MSLSHNSITLSDTTQTLIYGDAKSITITNIHASAIVYLGTSYVTSSSYGVKLTPGQNVSINNLGGDLYGISSINGSIVSILVSR